MKLIILIAVAFVAVVAAAPSEQKPVEILSSYFEQQPGGSYEFRFESGDGTIRQETGVVKEALDEENKLQKIVVVSGSYTFVNEGKSETITYFADESGYHAEGDSIPKIVSRR